MDYKTIMMMMATGLFQEVESPAGRSGIVQKKYRSGKMRPEGRPNQSEEAKEFSFEMERSTREVLGRVQKIAEQKFDEEDVDDLYMSLRSKTGGL